MAPDEGHPSRGLSLLRTQTPAAPTPDHPLPGRPPIVRNAFVGREASLREVVRWLLRPDARVVTLVGRSGVGKTRLALEAARRLTTSFPGGVAMLDGSDADERPIVDRVTAALEVRAAPGQTPQEATRRRLHVAPMLLIADDIDQVEGALDELLDLGASASSLRILATARLPTGHPEEHAIRLRPLPLPAHDADPMDIRSSPAVALYLTRADANNAGSAGSAGDLPAIVELCRRLDGLPLAIELAAARARVLSPTSQLTALDRGGPLSLRAPKDDRRPERHRDLRTALEVTWSMADPTEQAVLRRMAVFAAPPTIELLTAVVSDPRWPADDVIRALGALVDLGLVEPDEQPGGHTRYRLLPTIRAIALERLQEAGEEGTIALAHATTLLGFARTARPLPDALRAAALGGESADLALALARFETDGRLEEALELAAILVGMWVRVGVSAEAGATFQRLFAAADTPGSGVTPATLARGLVSAAILAIERSTPDEARAHVSGWLERARSLARAGTDRGALLLALEWSAIALPVTGDVPTAIAANTEALALAGTLDDQVALARCEYRASMLADAMGDVAATVALGASALRHARAIGDPESIVRTAMHLSWVAPDTPGLPVDLPTVEEALAIARANGMPFEEGAGYAILAVRSLMAGNLRSAAEWSADGLAFASRRGSWHAGTFNTVALLLIAGAGGDDILVARLHGVLLQALPEARQGQAPATRPLFEAAIARARSVLGDDAFAREEGSTASLDRDAGIDWAGGVARRLGRSRSDLGAERGRGGRGRDASGPRGGTDDVRADRIVADPSAVVGLTPRERDVLRVLAGGLTNREIGATLGLTEKTVMHHSSRIYAKLGVRGRAEATAWAVRSGIVDSER